MIPGRWSGIMLAAVLSAEGVSFVLIGSAALRLHGEKIPVPDIDVAPEPRAENITRLHAALIALAVRRGQIPAPRSLLAVHTVSIATSYGKLDCLLDRGRRDWNRLRAGAQQFLVSGTVVMVARAADTRALRSKHKEPAMSDE